MNRRSFLKFLGVSAPAAVTVAAMPTVFENLFLKAKEGLGWVSYKFKFTTTLAPPVRHHLMFDKELVANLKAQTPFKETAEQRKLMTYTSGKNVFFQYATHNEYKGLSK